jgi:redox-sensitive bicupin YhaK (pirin superfamily)
MGKGAEMFQIWFDPSLEKTLSQPASYDDYRAADFPQKNEGSTQITTLVGAGSPFQMDTPGVEVFRLKIENGAHTLLTEPDKIYSAYLLDGTATFNGEAAQQFDFVLATEQSEIRLETPTGADVFVIASPAQPGYRTYGQLARAAR